MAIAATEAPFGVMDDNAVLRTFFQGVGGAGGGAGGLGAVVTGDGKVNGAVIPRLRGQFEDGTQPNLRGGLASIGAGGDATETSKTTLDIKYKKTL